MDPEIFHERFIQAIRDKDNDSFLALLPKIATRNKEFRCKYFYIAGCEGTAVMVEHLLKKVQPKQLLIMDTLYDALNYNNTESVKVLAPYITDPISYMAATHIRLARAINPNTIKILSTYMIEGDFEDMVVECAQESSSVEDKLTAIWTLVNQDLFFKKYTLDHIERIKQDENRKFLKDQYEIYFANHQKIILQEHVGSVDFSSRRRI